MKKLQLSADELIAWKKARWAARFDLVYLCNEILGYTDVSHKVHGGLIKTLQQFPRPSKDQFIQNDNYENGKWKYNPIYSLKDFVNLAGKRRRLILDSRGHLKCLPAQELVQKQSGEYVPVVELKIGDKIKSSSSEYEIETYYTEIEQIEQQTQPVYQIEFRNGKKIQCSNNHPILTLRGWVFAENLKISDICYYQNLSHEPPSAKYYPQAEILGYFLGDGSFECGRVTNENPKIRGKIIEAAKRAGFESEFVSRKHLNRTDEVLIRKFRPWAKKLNLYNTKSGNKFIPDVIFKSDNKSVAELLQALFACDGTMNHAGIGYTSKSELLVRQIQRLLTRFGIPAQYSEVPILYKGERRNYYQLRISSFDAISIFIEKIGWIKSSTYTSTFGTKKLKTVTEVGIKSIKFLGNQTTYAIQTKSKTISVDDILTHNTTINCQAHTIQWLLNYPEAAIHIIQSNLDKANMIVDEIRDHFRYNPRLRQLFPDLCPQKSINDFGKVGEFNIRKLYDITSMRKEPSVLAGSIEKGTAGLHFDVMKFSDIVDPNNCFGDLLEKVAKSFYMAENLLVAPSYWIDVEGTRYNFGDVYGKLIESYEKAKKEGREPEYLMYVRACFERDTGDKNPEYTPEEQHLPFKKDANGKRIPVWADRFSLQKLEEMERTDPTIFSAQQLNFPIGGLDGQVLFPIDPKQNYPYLIEPKVFKDNVRISHYEISVDTAETVGGRSDYTAMVVCAWAKSGRAFITDILHGKFLPDQIVRNLFKLYEKWNKSRIAPVMYIKIEETGFVRGLKAAIGREEEIRGIKLPLQFIKRDTALSKTERILKTLQPWYINREIRFLDDIPAIEALKKELIQFPNSPHDDILDALSDLFNGKEYFGRTDAKPDIDIYKSKAFDAALGILNPFDDDAAYYTPVSKSPTHGIPW